MSSTIKGVLGNSPWISDILLSISIIQYISIALGYFKLKLHFFKYFSKLFILLLKGTVVASMENATTAENQNQPVQMDM